jgi:hypothetical protein
VVGAEQKGGGEEGQHWESNIRSERWGWRGQAGRRHRQHTTVQDARGGRAHGPGACAPPCSNLLSATHEWGIVIVTGAANEALLRQPRQPALYVSLSQNVELAASRHVLLLLPPLLLPWKGRQAAAGALLGTSLDIDKLDHCR